MKWLALVACLLWGGVVLAQSPTETPCTTIAFRDFVAQNSLCRSPFPLVDTWPPPFDTCTNGGIDTFAYSDIACNHTSPPSGCKAVYSAGPCSTVQYEYAVGLERFTLSAFPLGTTVTGGTFVFEFGGGGCVGISCPTPVNDQYQEWGEWYHDFTFPGTAADYTLVPSNTAWTIPPVWPAPNDPRCPPNLSTGYNDCSIPVNDTGQIPITGGVVALRLHEAQSGAPVVSCNNAQYRNMVLRVNYEYPCGAPTPTAGTPTATSSVTLTVPPSSPTQTPSRTATPSLTRTPTGVFLTPTITPSPAVGCCACPGSQLCSANATAETCPSLCTFGGPGSVCNLVPD